MASLDIITDAIKTNTSQHGNEHVMISREESPITNTKTQDKNNITDDLAQGLKEVREYSTNKEHQEDHNFVCQIESYQLNGTRENNYKTVMALINDASIELQDERANHTPDTDIEESKNDFDNSKEVETFDDSKEGEPIVYTQSDNNQHVLIV